MSITGLKLSQINTTTEVLKDSDFFYFVSPSAGPLYESRKGDLSQLAEYVDNKVGEVLRQEFTDADQVLKEYAETIVKAEKDARIAALADEAALREVADTEEATARTVADDALGQRITNETNARIDAVQLANQSRSEGDAAEAAARNAADAEILEALATEATQRGAADTSLTNALATEVSARATAEAALTKAIADEGAARAASDASIIDALTEEETARIAAVATLQTSISNESAIRSAAITDLTTALSEEIEERAVADAEEIVARTKAISDEADARMAADNDLADSIATQNTNLTALINTEKAARESADSSLANTISIEKAALVALINAEQTARASGDSTEKLERIAADSDLQEAFNDSIQAEITARISAVSAEETARIAAVSAEETARIESVNNVANRVSAIEGVLPLKADLVGGKIPAAQLPAYVDDVLEVSLFEDLPVEGEAGKIYVVKLDNLTYRWSGTAYIEISKSLALGETFATAYRGDQGKAAYDHSQVVTGNPHGTTKEDLGLGNVDDTADIDKPISTATQDALDLKVDIKELPFHTEAGDYGVQEVVLAYTSTSATPITSTVDLVLPVSCSAIVKERQLINNTTAKTMTETTVTSSLSVDAAGVITVASGDIVISGTTATFSYVGVDATTVKVMNFVTIEWIKD